MDAIEFLERVGADARVRHGSEQDLREVAADFWLEKPMAAALVARDRDAVYGLLGQGSLWAMQVPAEEEEAPEDDEGDGAGELPTLRQ